MTLYLDTSVLVAAFTTEAATPRVQQWFRAQPGDLAISDWVAAEFSSALAIKLRSGAISLEVRNEALSTFHQFALRSFSNFPVASEHFELAARFVDRYELSLRASDALHLAVAFDNGATLCTLDKKMASAGAALAVLTSLL